MTRKPGSLHCWLRPPDIARRWQVDVTIVIILLERGRLPGHLNHQRQWLVSRASVVRFEQASLRLGIPLERYYY